MWTNSIDTEDIMQAQSEPVFKPFGRKSYSKFLKEKRLVKRNLILGVYLVITCVVLIAVLPLRLAFSSRSYSIAAATSDRSNSIHATGVLGKSLRFRRSSTLNNNATLSTSVNGEEECNPPSVEEFPSLFLSEADKHNGAFLVHLLVALYMFVALAVVCDDFFVPSLEVLCEKLHMSEDVAGATFMSAGSSAPEFFTSLIGVFVVKGDVGVSTIVGSAVFNILCIIGICALFSGRVIQLTWWPLCRDSSYYLISVVALLAVAYDDQIKWFESVFLLVLYIFYIVIMVFNCYIQEALNRRFASKEGPLEVRVHGIALQSPEFSPSAMYSSSAQQYMISCNDKEILQPRDFADASLRIMLKKNFKPACRMRAAARIIIAARKRETQITLVTEEALDKYAEQGKCQIIIERRRDDAIVKDPNFEQGSGEDSNEDEVGLCSMPSSKCGWVKWVVLLPINLAFFLTIPNCAEEKWRSWYPVTFVNSVFWTSALSYVMVWMTAVVGDALHIPETVMGVTFLAAGTSIPDSMASLLVARQGMGDMAVSNSIGSNVFDILVGLGVPWFLRTVVVSWKHTIPIRSKGLKYSVVLLFVSVAVTLACIACNRWKLNKKLGVVFLSSYALYILMACLIELNVFAVINPPTC